MTNAGHANGTDKDHVEKAIEARDRATGLTPKQLARDARVRLLRSKAAVLRSEVDAIAATHVDPDTLEEMLSNASPDEVLRIEKAEHAISARVSEARTAAEAAEADYEQAVLDQNDDA